MNQEVPTFRVDAIAKTLWRHSMLRKSRGPKYLAAERSFLLKLKS
jgi:hypothetical protein